MTSAEDIAVGEAQGPGGVYRLACTAAGLLLAELPTAGRTEAAFRDRVEELRMQPSFAPATRPASDQLALYQALIAAWSSDTAWELFWRAPPLDLRGTLFRRCVWATLCSVPPGEVVTYGELARRSGSPRSARAVGSAMHFNPAPLFVPCHRVVASNGIGGFGNVGLGLKRELLAIEGLREL